MDSFELLNTSLDIRILNRKKNIFEAFILIPTEGDIILEKGSVVLNDSALKIPLLWQDCILGYVSHIIEFYEFFYIKGYFSNDMNENVFNIMNSGDMRFITIEFFPQIKKTKHNVKRVFAMDVHKFHIYESNVIPFSKKDIVYQSHSSLFLKL